VSETATYISLPVDRSLFSLHPEEEMTERRGHAHQSEYFVFALERTLPDLFIARNLAVYWVPDQMQEPWAGPDILVSRQHPAEADPSVYLTYQDGPLAFVCEVASRRTRGKEAERRDETYAQALAVPEHLFIDLQRHVLELSELVNGRYQRIAPDAAGRHWSRELGIGFQWQPDGRRVRVLTALGEVVPTAQEETARRYEAEALAQEEARQRTVEATRAAEAEARAAEETRQRKAAEARATEAEARAAALAAEVERLRRARDVPPSE
jgi:Uma2 family endonuclease